MARRARSPFPPSEVGSSGDAVALTCVASEVRGLQVRWVPEFPHEGASGRGPDMVEARAERMARAQTELDRPAITQADRTHRAGWAQLDDQTLPPPAVAEGGQHLGGDLVIVHHEGPALRPVGRRRRTARRSMAANPPALHPPATAARSAPSRGPPCPGSTKARTVRSGPWNFFSSPWHNLALHPHGCTAHVRQRTSGPLRLAGGLGLHQSPQVTHPVERAAR